MNLAARRLARFSRGLDAHPWPDDVPRVSSNGSREALERSRPPAQDRRYMLGSPARLARRLALLGLAAAGSSCTDLDRYSTAPSESYCGPVTLSSSFRSGFSPVVQMRLQLDAAELDGEISPGVMWTYEAAVGEVAERRLLNRAPLRRIPKLANDPLSMLDIGAGRDHTRMFAVTPADSDEDPLLAILSLRSDDGVEVRLLRPGIAGTATKPAAPGRQPVFGLFTLYKQVGTCGF
jgi:hypothetical protein